MTPKFDSFQKRGLLSYLQVPYNDTVLAWYTRTQASLRCHNQQITTLLTGITNLCNTEDCPRLFTLWVLSQFCKSLKFLAHLVYQSKSLIQSCFVCCHHWHCPASSLVSSLSSVHTSPWHMVRHRNFILGTLMYICPPYMHIRYLMVLTCSF